MSKRCVSVEMAAEISIVSPELPQNGNREHNVQVRSGSNKMKRAGLMDLGPLQESKPGPKEKNEERYLPSAGILIISRWDVLFVGHLQDVTSRFPKQDATPRLIS